jgi:hypothetical protein
MMIASGGIDIPLFAQAVATRLRTSAVKPPGTAKKSLDTSTSGDPVESAKKNARA